MENLPMPSIGVMIESYLTEKRIHKAVLARELSVSFQQLIRIRKQNNMQVSRLWQFSHILKHNFIADIAAQLPSGYTGALQDALAEKDKQIAALQNELAAMAKERDIYKDLLKR